MKLYISNNTRFSGNGVFSKYYHLIIDFCLPIFFHADANEKITIYKQRKSMVFDAIPGSLSQSKIDNILNTIFSNRLNIVELECQEKNSDEIWLTNNSKESYNLDEKYIYGILSKFINESKHKGLWSNYPAEYYTKLKDYFFNQFPDLANDENNKKITVVVRGQKGARSWRPKQCEIDKIYSLYSSDVEVEFVDFAELPFIEQIKKMISTSVLIGSHGAGLTNAMFLKPESTLIELGHRAFPCFEILAEKCNIKYLTSLDLK